MKLGIYCGSFAPVHNGHLGIIREVLKEKCCDRIIVVPTKDYWDKVVSISFEDRVKCLKLFESDKVWIDTDLEDCFSANTYTLLNNLKKKYPDDQLCLIVGADNLPAFKKWVNADYLLENYPFIVMNREGYETEKELEKLNKKDYCILKCPNFNVSSTYIRENIEDYDKLKDLLPKEVYEIIKNSIN